MWGKRRQRQQAPGGGQGGADLDPSYALVLAMEAAKQASPGSLARARADVHTAEALYELGRQASGGDLRPQAATVLDQAIPVLDRHLPDSRSDLANAHYLAADMARGSDWPLARQHYEAALPLVRRDGGELMMWVAVHEGLAAALVKGPGGDTPAAQERALALYLDVLTVEPPTVPADHWAATAQGLARTLAERYKGKNIDNWGNAFQWASRAVERTTDRAGDQLRAGNFLIYGRAAIGYGVPMLLSHQADAGQYLAGIKKGAGILDRLGVTGGAPLAPAADELTAAAAAASSSATWPGAAVLRAGLGLLSGIQDRRGQVELHALLALTSAGLTAADRQRHLVEAERLLSASDDEYLRLFIGTVRKDVEGRG
jgi:hypothetical protein